MCNERFKSLWVGCLRGRYLNYQQVRVFCRDDTTPQKAIKTAPTDTQTHVSIWAV